ncbi:MAG: VWA domain-containing protein [Acidobacteriota bacterium]|jgi:Ca-activated chloride channel homolog
MDGFSFLHPAWLLALLLLPVLLFWKRWSLKKHRRAVLFPLALDMESLAGRKRYYPWIAPALMAAALGAFIVALARPVLTFARTTVTTEGVAIMLCIDISGSMRAEDFQPSNRIDVARDVVSDFISRRKNDRVGLITFAAMPFLRCPLTLDHKTLQTIVHSLDAVTRQDIDGTAIGDALIAAGKRILHAPEKSKVVVLLTDGENNRGQFDPIQAARLLAKHHIKVYVVGIGSSGVVPYPVDITNGQKTYQYVKIGFNEQALKKIAEITGGVYYNATDAKGLNRVFTDIDRLERSKVTSTGYVRYEQLFLWPVGIGLLLMCLQALWGAGPGRSLP